MSSREVSASLARDFLVYHPEDGRLIWKARAREHFASEKAWKMWNTRYPGREAFTSLDDKGYHQGTIGGQRQLKHRVIMAIVNGEWPARAVDHINGIKTDNRLSNIRLVSKSENQRNQSRNSNNKSGVTGVWLDTRSGKWRAAIGRKGLGLHGRFEDAVRARSCAAEMLGYHPNHGREKQYATL